MRAFAERRSSGSEYRGRSREENRGQVRARDGETAGMGPARRRPEAGDRVRGARQPAVTNGRSVIAEADGPPATAGRDRVAPRALGPRIGRGGSISWRRGPRRRCQGRGGGAATYP